jgi:hypothetical protein
MSDKPFTSTSGPVNKPTQPIPEPVKPKKKD